MYIIGYQDLLQSRHSRSSTVQYKVQVISYVNRTYAKKEGQQGTPLAITMLLHTMTGINRDAIINKMKFMVDILEIATTKYEHV